MIRAFTALVCLVFMLSCNCQKPVKKEEKELSSDEISQFLGEKNFKILQQSKTIVVVFYIDKKLIEGTKDEYSNKLVIKDTLDTTDKDDFLLKLQNDNLYDWNNLKSDDSFEPSKQFLLKGEKSQISLMLDETRSIMGYINLEGQKLVPINKDLSNFLREL